MTKDIRKLTKRQREILQLLALDYTYEEVAKMLDRSYGTIKNAMRDARQRTGYQTTGGLIAAVCERPAFDN